MNHFFSFNIYSLLIELFILFSICLLLLFGVIFSTSKKKGYPILSNISVNFLFIQIIALALALALYQSPIFMLSWNNSLISNSFTIYIKLLILIMSFIWYFVTITYINYLINNFEYWILVLLSILSILLINQSYDLLSIYLTLEFQSLSFYILASFIRNSEFSTEAGLKYFLLGAFASGFLLFGFSLLYSFTGLTNLTDLSNFFSDNYLYQEFYFSKFLYISLLFILVSFFFKLGVAPFHSWLPDVYEGSPSSVMIFFATVPKLVLLSLVIRILNNIFYELITIWFSSFSIVIFISSFIGTLGALYQVKWKRFIAYSSVNHVSFFLLMLGINNIDSLQNLFIYLFIYLFTLLGFSAFFINFRYLQYPISKSYRFFINLQILGTLNPLLGFSLSILFFSLAGIPPLAGFFAKFFVLFSATKNNIFGLVGILLFFNSIASFYYLRLIQLSFFLKIPIIFPIIFPLSHVTSVIIGLSTLLSLMLFLDLEFIFFLMQLLTFSFLKI